MLRTVGGPGLYLSPFATAAIHNIHSRLSCTWEFIHATRDDFVAPEKVP